MALTIGAENEFRMYNFSPVRLTVKVIEHDLCVRLSTLQHDFMSFISSREGTLAVYESGLLSSPVDSAFSSMEVGIVERSTSSPFSDMDSSRTSSIPP